MSTLSSILKGKKMTLLIPPPLKNGFARMNALPRGFSLVEILVGLAIGMIGIIIMMQVFQVSEGRKRTTTGAADAQTSGATALYLMERDIRMGGWGLNPSLYLGKQSIPVTVPPKIEEPGCATMRTNCTGGAASCGGVAGAITDFSFASVRITDGGTGPDTIAAQFFSNPSDNAFVPAGGINFVSDLGAPPDTLSVAYTTGCSTGSLILVSDPSNGTCTLMQATLVPAGPPAPTTIEHKTTSPYNPAAGWPAPAITTNAKLACFPAAPDGPIFRRQYSVNATQQLLRTDNTVTPVVTNELVTSGIMDMQAQYGVSDAVGYQNVKPSSWVDAKKVDAASDWENPTPASGLQRIKAVRIAILARSGQYEKPTTAGDCTATTAAMAAAWSSWATFDTTTYPDGWDCYRYKVFETIVPLRNVIWANI